MSPADEIEALFASAGARDYLGEPVTVAAHLLQAGALAASAGAPPALIAAALLHDTGHLRGEDPARAGLSGRELMAGTDNDHGERGARWLSAWFPPSVYTLSVQGGPMTEAEAREFAAHPYAADAIRVRRWDEAAKDPGADTPDFSDFRPVLESLLR